MDWTVNDNLYHRFLKWHLKCKNILECKFAALPECQQCKKVVACSGNCSMDQYVSWNLPSSELTLDIIWGKYKEYCKQQSNEVQARFDLLRSFCQGNCSIDKWYNAIQAQVNLARYPLETANILHRDIFWFFLRDEDFISRTISDGSVDLDKFPVSRVCQLAKKLESSKAMARHIKQVLGEPQAAKSIYCITRGQSYLNTDTKRKSLMQNPDRVTVNCYTEMTCIKVRRSRATTSHLLQTGCHPQASTTGVQSVVILPTGKDSHAQQKSISARYVINLDILPANVFNRNSIHNRNTDNLKHIKYK